MSSKDWDENKRLRAALIIERQRHWVPKYPGRPRPKLRVWFDYEPEDGLSGFDSTEDRDAFSAGFHGPFLRRVTGNEFLQMPYREAKSSSRSAHRQTFTVPEGYEAVLDSDGFATGEIRPREDVPENGQRGLDPATLEAAARVAEDSKWLPPDGPRFAHALAAAPLAIAYAIRALDPAPHHGIYIASKCAHARRWRILRDKIGYPIISTWIDEAEPSQSADLNDLWRRCITEASSAEVLVVNREPGEVLKGAWVEVGAALASGVPVLAVGLREFTIAQLKQIQHFDSMAGVMTFLKPMVNGTPFTALEGVQS